MVAVFGWSIFSAALLFSLDNYLLGGLASPEFKRVRANGDFQWSASGSMRAAIPGSIY